MTWSRLRGPLAVVLLLAGGLAVLLWALEPDDAPDAAACHQNGGIYLWHKRECVGKREARM